MTTPRNDRELASVAGPLKDALRRLGLSDIETLLTLMKSWDELAGQPWAGVSAPVFLRDGELTVEAAALSTVRMLRYATGELLEHIDAFCGPRVVESVRVVGPR